MTSCKNVYIVKILGCKKTTFSNLILFEYLTFVTLVCSKHRNTAYLDTTRGFRGEYDKNTEVNVQMPFSGPLFPKIAPPPSFVIFWIRRWIRRSFGYDYEYIYISIAHLSRKNDVLQFVKVQFNKESIWLFIKQL